MKKIIFILTVFVLSFTSIISNAKNSPKINLLKENLKLSDISDKSEKYDKSGISDIGCDLCGCYMGLEPNFSKNSFGIRYTSYEFYSSPHSAEENSNLDHPTSSTESYEYYRNIEIFFRYYFSPKFRVIATIPYSFNQIDSLHLNGVGDLLTIAQYQIYNTNMVASTNFWQRIFLGAGFKFPTGVYNKSLSVSGEVEPHFQPGTGSLDFLFSGLYIAKHEKTGLGWRNDIVYTINTENKNGYRFANKLNFASTLTYEIDTDPLVFLPHAGVYYETAGMDKQDEVSVDDSGGNSFFGTAGLDIYYGDYSLDFNMNFPVSEKLNGDQPGNELRFFVGLGFAF